jgi:hypothetical protein
MVHIKEFYLKVKDGTLIMTTGKSVVPLFKIDDTYHHIAICNEMCQETIYCDGYDKNKASAVNKLKKLYTVIMNILKPLKG